MELVPVAGDTARLVDRRIGLAIAIPGHPRLLAPAASSGASEPRYEALIQLADVPVSLRYRRDERPGDATANAPLLAELYATSRCRREDLRRAAPASDAQCRAWGVTAAASTLYPLREPDAAGDDTEEVLLLVRGGEVVTLTKRFARAQTSWLAWSLLNSALAAGVRWELAAAGSPWPRSRLLLPGVQGVLVAARRADAERLAAHAGSHDRLADALAAVLRGSEPPAQPIGDAERAAYRGYLADACADRALASELDALLAEVETAHDARGVAVLALHALGKLTATFGAPGDEANPLAFLAE